jgi:hypothetical protein
LLFFAREIAIKDELFRNAANSREYQSQFAAGNVPMLPTEKSS